MTKEPVCGNTPALSRRSFLAAAPAVGLIGLHPPALALPRLTFEERAVEIADLMRQHFRTNLPEGCQRYSVQIYDAWDREADPVHDVNIVGYAKGLHWFPKCGWH